MLFWLITPRCRCHRVQNDIEPMKEGITPSARYLFWVIKAVPRVQRPWIITTHGVSKGGVQASHRLVGFEQILQALHWVRAVSGVRQRDWVQPLSTTNPMGLLLHLCLLRIALCQHPACFESWWLWENCVSGSSGLGGPWLGLHCA